MMLYYFKFERIYFFILLIFYDNPNKTIRFGLPTSSAIARTDGKTKGTMWGLTNSFAKQGMTR